MIPLAIPEQADHDGAPKLDKKIRLPFAPDAEVHIKRHRPASAPEDQHVWRFQTLGGRAGGDDSYKNLIHDLRKSSSEINVALRSVLDDYRRQLSKDVAAEPQAELKLSVRFLPSLNKWVILRTPSREGDYDLRLVITTHDSLTTLSDMNAELAAQAMITRNMDALLDERPDQHLPIMVYVGGDTGPDALSPVEEALREVLEAYDQTLDDCHGPFFGSIAKWFKGVKRGARELSNSEIGKDLAAEAQRAIQLRAVDLEQAKVDDAKAAAVAKLIEAAASHDVVTIQAGSMLLLKDNDMLFVRELTPREMIYLRRNSHLVTTPKALLSGLNSCALDPDSQACELPSHLIAEPRTELARGVE